MKAKLQLLNVGRESHAKLYQALKESTAGICRGDEPPGATARYWLLATVQGYDDAGLEYCIYDDRYRYQLEQWEILGGRLELLRAVDLKRDWLANRIIQRPGEREWIGISFPMRHHGERGFLYFESAKVELQDIRAALMKQPANFEDLYLENLLVWMPTIVVVDKELFDERRLDHLK